MKFSDYRYTRPDYEAIKAQMAELTQELATAPSAQAARGLVEQITAISAAVDTQMNLWSIRHSIDKYDDFYNEETKFWNEHGPLFDELWTNYYRVIVDSPYRPDLADFLPEPSFCWLKISSKPSHQQPFPFFKRKMNWWTSTAISWPLPS